MARKQTLFYADVVNLLRFIYPPKDYIYRDDFNGELIILRNSEHLIAVEIKSEKEVDKLSTQSSGTTFKVLRNKINSLRCFTNRGDGKHKGWLAILAQCWDYMQNGLPSDIQRDTFSIKEDILVLPYDKKVELNTALCNLYKYYQTIQIPEPTILDYPTDNISILIYRHDHLDSFFNGVQKIDNESSACETSDMERNERDSNSKNIPRKGRS